jgi:hypothetical protein
MNTIGNKIQEIIEGQGLNFFRSVNINDLNQQVGTIDVANGLGVYTNLPEINTKTFGMTNAMLMEYTVEVYYLKLNNEVDDLGFAIDDILNELLPLAHGMIDQFNQSGIVAPSNFIDGYQLTAVETLKFTKEVLTGWQLSFTVPLYRKDFTCD